MLFRFFTFVLLLMLCACKKEENSKTVISSTSLGTPAPAPAVTATFHALCSAHRSYNVVGSNLLMVNSASSFAYFDNIARSNFDNTQGTLTAAGDLSLNGTTFKNASLFYVDTTNSTFSEPFSWQGSGGAFPAFSFTNSTAFASYAGYVSWPDTIHKTYGFSISLTALQRADEVMLRVWSPGNAPLTQTALVSAGSVSFTGSSLAALNSAATATLHCHFFKNNIQTIQGRQVNFRNETTYIKAVPVK